MLLWFDSLAHRTQAHLATRYPIVLGTPTLLQAHQRAAAASVGGAGSFQTPVFTPTGDRCVVGFLLRLTGNPSGASTLLEFRGSGGTAVQSRVRLRPSAEGPILQVEQGLGADVLLKTPPLPTNHWVFVEFSALFGTGDGVFVVRLDGVEFARAQGGSLKLSPSFPTGWDALRFSLIPSAGLLLADIYILDENPAQGPLYTSFLGPVMTTSVGFGEAVSRGLAHSLNPGNKYRVVVLAGQSNMTGTVSAASSPLWRSPNPKVEIWDRISGPAAWRPLEARVNTAGMFLLPPGQPISGPEMRLAERIAQFYESSGLADTPRVRVVKGTQDASFLFPTVPDFSWDPATPNNLYSGFSSPRGCLHFDLIQALTSIGSGAVERVDFFWLQGEADALFEISSRQYADRLQAFFQTVVADIGALTPAPVTVHILRIHRDLFRGEPGFGFSYADSIRTTQDRAGELIPGSRLISIDEAEISPADLAHMTLEGYASIGDRMFESWLAAQNYDEYLSDYQTQGFVDDLWLGSSQPAVSVFRASGREIPSAGPVLASALDTHSATDDLADPRPAGIYQGDLLIQQINPSTTSWKFERYFSVSPRYPEELDQTLRIET